MCCVAIAGGQGRAHDPELLRELTGHTARDPINPAIEAAPNEGDLSFAPPAKPKAIDYAPIDSKLRTLLREVVRTSGRLREVAGRAAKALYE